MILHILLNKLYYRENLKVISCVAWYYILKVLGIVNKDFDQSLSEDVSVLLHVEHKVFHILVLVWLLDHVILVFFFQNYAEKPDAS